jgi:hypothetical protein
VGHQSEVKVSEEQARKELLQAINDLANGAPSLADLYHLEYFVVYSDHLREADKILLAQWELLGHREAWLKELQHIPPDLTLWFQSYDRTAGLLATIQIDADKWTSASLQRVFSRHHYLQRPSDMALLHIRLLKALDPLAAVEYAVALPSAHFLWGAGWELRLETDKALVARVLADGSRDAALWVLACELESLEEIAKKHIHELRTMNGHLTKDEELIETTGIVNIRIEQIVAAVLRRNDVDALLEPWLCHLSRAIDIGERWTDDVTPAIARCVVDRTHQAIELMKLIVTIPFERDAASFVAAVVIADATQRANSGLWDKWETILISEHGSLSQCKTFGWKRAATALLWTLNPAAIWTATAQKLLPHQRRIERGRANWTIDVMSHLLMPAVYACAELHDRDFWWLAYDLARRHVLTAMPPQTEVNSYWLPSWFFASFSRVFGDDSSRLQTALDLLPTSKHHVRAELHLRENQLPALLLDQDRGGHS